MVGRTDYSQATTVVFSKDYLKALSMVGIGQMTRLNARFLPFLYKNIKHINISIQHC